MQFLQLPAYSLSRFYSKVAKLIGNSKSDSKGEPYDGFVLHRHDSGFLCHHGGINLWLRTAEEIGMTWLYTLSGVIAAALFVYLIIALLKPELFS